MEMGAIHFKKLSRGDAEDFLAKRVVDSYASLGFFDSNI